MQKGKTLRFKCLGCEEEVSFSVFELEEQGEVCCEHCKKRYAFDDPTLLRQLKKFDALCRQIRDSEEILGMANIGVDIANQQVKIPYRLLLTRLNSQLELKINETPLTIMFRLEPVQDYA